MEEPSILIRCHTMTKAGHHNVAGIVARGGKTHGLCQPHHPHWIMGLRVTEVQCQLPYQCHQGLIDLWAPGICIVADVAGSQEAIWKSILPVFKDKDMKDAITYQSWHWDLMVYHHTGCWDCTLLSYVICSCKAILGSSWEVWGQSSP